MIRILPRRAMLAVPALLLLAACGGGGDEEVNAPQPLPDPAPEEAVGSPTETDDARSAPELLSDQAELSLFLTLLEEAELASALEGEEGITIFAPTDAAFNALPGETLETLRDPAFRDQLSDLLRHHLSRTVAQGYEGQAMTFPTLLQSEVRVDARGDVVTVGDAVVAKVLTGADGRATVFVIDTVLLPPVEN